LFGHAYEKLGHW